MTIKLLGAYGDVPAGAIITLDAVTEAALIAAKSAVADLTGGFVWDAPDGSPGPNVSPIPRSQALAVAAEALIEYHPAGYFPSLSITDAIIATAVAVGVIGQGIVCLPAGVTTLTATLPLISGVRYRGAGLSNNLRVAGGVNVFPGTILLGNGTFPAFSYNATDGATSPTNFATFMDGMVVGAAVSDLTMRNFTFGIKVGALYQPGCQGSEFKNLQALDCGWGYWFENQILCRFDGLYAGRVSVGLGAIVNSGGTALNSGNSPVRALFGETENNLTRGWCFWGRGAVGGFLNDLSIDDIQCNRSRAAITQAATMANASANITVTDGTKFAVDLPVSFSAAVNGFQVNHVYFVVSLVGNVIQVSETVGGTAKVATGNTAVNCVHYGFSNFEMVGYGANGVQPSFVEGMDMEGGATTRILIQNCEGVQFQLGTCGGEEGTANVRTVTVRNSRNCLVVSPNPITFDIDDLSISTQVQAAKKDLGAGAGGQTSTGIGLQWFTGGDTRAKTNSGMIALSGQFGPDINVNKATGAIEFASAPIMYAYYYTVASGGTVPLGNLVVYTGAGGGNCTLPVIPANGEGVPVLISNSSNGTLTVNQPSGQTINGLAAAVVIPANSAKQFCSASKSGVNFWVAA